ncbi:unnamed protein product, partial [Polarella glacialis]
MHLRPSRPPAAPTAAINFDEHFAAETAPVAGQMTFVEGVCYPEPLALQDAAPEPSNYNDDPDADYERVQHPFDGDGMVSAVTFDGSGKAHFRNRFVRTKGFVEELKEGKMLYRGQFSPKAGGWMANAFDMKIKNVANTNVMHWGGRLLALWEGGKPTELDPLSLATIGESSLAGALRSEDNFTAHPRYDARTGRM